jgi:hypothetical protein
MSQGSKIISLRIGDDRNSAILARIAKLNLTRSAEPYTLTSWILMAIDEQLDKPRRAARAQQKRRKLLQNITREIITLDNEEV